VDESSLSSVIDGTGRKVAVVGRRFLANWRAKVQIVLSKQLSTGNLNVSYGATCYLEATYEMIAAALSRLITGYRGCYQR
jgi:hypothetical protein